jgi:hypothetical protein
MSASAAGELVRAAKAGNLAEVKRLINVVGVDKNSANQVTCIFNSQGGAQ